MVKVLVASSLNLNIEKSMNMEKQFIGGYLDWEFSIKTNPFPHEEGVLVNSGHGALQLILQHIGTITKVWIPYFTCNVVLDTLKRLRVKHEFYHINYDLEVAELPQLKNNEYFIYTNYFGIMDRYVDFLVKIYGTQLIIDNAQAFFAYPHRKCHQIYSPRKFVGVPDGGIALSPMGLDISYLQHSKSYDTCQHLLMRSEGFVLEGYDYFKKNDENLGFGALAQMSTITQKILHSLDYETIISTRRYNYKYLNSHLQASNGLKELLCRRDIEESVCPMIYPFYTDDIYLRARLIKQHIFVAQYWPNVLEWCTPNEIEYSLCQHIIPLPIDQRYDEEDMNRIVNTIFSKK
jgi:hypothetical protein